ncbi:MAG: DciA family protein [Legionella sp.]|nr:DciA family protein [Legionella sp.]
MRKITQCFTASLASIFEEATQLKTLTALVQEHLGLEEVVPCQVSRFSKGCLVLAVEDAVWAARLRYELPTLRDQLRRAGLHHLTAIQINVSPAAKKPLKKTKRRAILSKQAKQTIGESAKHCSYEPLKAALERLGKH